MTPMGNHHAKYSPSGMPDAESTNDTDCFTKPIEEH